MNKINRILESLNKTSVNEASIPALVFKKLEDIAKVSITDLTTLKTQNSDSYDFYEVSTYDIMDSLKRSYALGYLVGKDGLKSVVKVDMIAILKGRITKDHPYLGVSSEPNIISKLEDIAKKEFGTVYTTHDFPEVSVWGIRDSMYDAYNLGITNNKKDMSTKVGKVKF